MPIALLTRPRPYFFYASGTSYVLGMMTGQAYDLTRNTVYGINGQQGAWTGIRNDAFASFLDPLKWNRVKIGYPAAIFALPSLAMGPSIDAGVRQTVDAINALPKGTPFALGGVSQGAAVMSLVLKNHLQTSTAGYPNITSRYDDLKAAVMFGNPCRKTDSLWPAFKTYAGGSISATTDNPTGTTGGHGCFPSSYRLTTVPSYWYEFVGSRDAVVDPVSSCGDGTIGSNFAAAMGVLLNQGLPGIIAALAGSLTGFTTNMLNAVVNTISTFGLNGHTDYPFKPPPGYAADAPTSYQIALEYLDMIGDQLGTAPSMIPRAIGGSGGQTYTGNIHPRATPSFRPLTSTTVLPKPPVSVRGTPINNDGSAKGTT